MGARGKKSSAAMEVVRTDNITAISRARPPEHLTDEQAAEWRAVVDRMPADWFPRETHMMLAQYCRHVVESRRIAELLETIKSGSGDDNWLADYDRLLKMQERESRAMTLLARSMRMTQQSTVTKNKGKGGTSVKKPWET